MKPVKSAYVKQALRGFSGYVPGEQPVQSRGILKLNTNENPYPPSPRVFEALQGFDAGDLGRYPDPTSQRLREAAGDLLGVSPDWVIAGNGSDELLAMVLRAFLDPGQTVTYPVPTYSLYPTLVKMYGGVTVEKPADLGAPKVEAVIDTPAAVTFIASPNAPDGYAVKTGEIARLCKAREGIGVVVADEAYVDFTFSNSLPLVSEHENLIVTRSLSKSFSLAGLRVGLAIAQPGLVQPLLAVRDSYNLGTLAQVLATAAIEDVVTMRANADRIMETREETTHALVERGWKVYPSEANFIFAIPPGGGGEKIYRGLVEKGIYVRYFDAPPLRGGVRITIGTSEDMTRLIGAIDEEAEGQAG